MTKAELDLDVGRDLKHTMRQPKSSAYQWIYIKPDPDLSSQQVYTDMPPAQSFFGPTHMSVNMSLGAGPVRLSHQSDHPQHKPCMAYLNVNYPSHEVLSTVYAVSRPTLELSVPLYPRLLSPTLPKTTINVDLDKFTPFCPIRKATKW